MQIHQDMKTCKSNLSGNKCLFKGYNSLDTERPGRLLNVLWTFSLRKSVSDHFETLCIKGLKHRIHHMKRFTLCYHLCYLKNVKSTYGGVLILVKLQAEARNFSKSNTPRWFFSLF